MEDVVRTRIPQGWTRKMFMENKENESLKISAKLVDLEDAEEFLKKSAIGKEKN